MKKKRDYSDLRRFRHMRLRTKIAGTSERPRMCVIRSIKHLEVQCIDDIDMTTLVSASTRDKDVRKQIPNGGTLEAAKKLGKIFAQKAKSKNVNKVVMDRAGFVYKGRLRAFADSAREAGLQF